MIPMINEQLLIECKKGLNIPVSSTVFDGVLMQKLMAVRAFLSGAGVSDAILGTDLAIGVIVIGVTDLWNLQGGEIKFSPAFYALLTQLAIGSLEEE